MMNDAKLHLEYELKQKNENTNKVLNDLKSQNIDLTNELAEKNSIYEKLFADKTNLLSNLDERNKEHDSFAQTAMNNDRIINELNQAKNKCENDALILGNTTKKNADDINNLIIENVMFYSRGVVFSRSFSDIFNRFTMSFHSCTFKNVYTHNYSAIIHSRIENSITLSENSTLVLIDVELSNNTFVYMNTSSYNLPKLYLVKKINQFNYDNYGSFEMREFDVYYKVKSIRINLK